MTISGRFTALRPTVLLTAAMLPFIAACGDASASNSVSDTASAAQSAPPVSVSVSTVSELSAREQITATGTFGSRDEIALAFKIGGVVARVLVDEGATVQRGQLLASLDLREINAAVDKAQAGFDKAQRDQARVQRLVADSVATRVQLQDATSALDAARADLVTAKVNREFATIVAPENGIVLQRVINAGANVSPGTTVIQLGGTRRGRVLRAGITDRDAIRVRLGDSALVQFDAVPGRTYSGRVILVGRSADPRTGTYTVEVAIADADALPSGLVGNLSIMSSSASGSPSTKSHASVPVDALLEADRDSATVYTVSTSGTAEPVAQTQRVRIAGLSGDRALITGLAPDTRIVTQGASYVTAGARVRIVSADTLMAATTAKKVRP